MVQLQIPNAYRNYTKTGKDVYLTGETVGEAFLDLLRQYPTLRSHLITPGGELRPFINFFVNGENIKSLQGLETPLKDDDMLQMVASIAGG